MGLTDAKLEDANDVSAEANGLEIVDAAKVAGCGNGFHLGKKKIYIYILYI